MIRKSTFEWLILLALTGLSFRLADNALASGTVLLPVLVATAIKGRIVIDRFMGLQEVAPLWRWIVLGWLVVVLGAITYAFQGSAA